MSDSVHRRITVEFGTQYVYAYMTNRDGRILDEEVWREPVRLDLRETHEGAVEAWNCLYQHLLDSMVFPSASTDAPDDSVEEEPPE